MSRCSNSQRAQNCLRAADVLWHRCEKGIDLVFPDPENDPGPEKRKRAAKLLLKLIEAGGRLAKTAQKADPAAYRIWRESRKERYSEEGWDWPPSPEVATQTRLDLVQAAWPTSEIPTSGAVV